MLRHEQLLAAVAGPLAAIATTAATAAAITVKDTNRICRPPFCLAVARSGIMSPRPVAAMRQIASAEKCYRTTIRARIHAGTDPRVSAGKSRSPCQARGDRPITGWFSEKMVRPRGLEPPRVAPLASQASASTNSATAACGCARLARRRGCNRSVIGKQGLGGATSPRASAATAP